MKKMICNTNHFFHFYLLKKQNRTKCDFVSFSNKYNETPFEMAQKHDCLLKIVDYFEKQQKNKK